MDPLHAGAYNAEPTSEDEDDGVPANQLQGHYLDQAPKTIANHSSDSSDEIDSSDEEYGDNSAPPADNNLSKRTEIEEADRVVLPSILTSDEKLDWTLRFISVFKDLRRKEPYPFVSRTILKLAALERDFLHTAKLYAKIIIDEKFLPNEKKTIKPANMGGIAGGLKYFQEGILFKFALDSHGIYGGDINAMKSAGHEMKCIVSLVKRLKPDYFVPMVGVIDYKGFRIIAISLLPIKESTLIYGSNDGGKTFHASDPVVNNDMTELGASLNLQAHTVCKDKVIRTPADLEVHKGTDGRYYLVDVARLWPPEPPSVKGSFLYRLLREEFVTTYKKPLSSDAFSGFANSDPKSKEYNAHIREAFEFYVKQFVPAVAQELHQMSLTVTDLETYLHSRGINFRHMGLLWQHLPSFSPWRRVVMSEIVTRAAKSVLRSLMRRSIERFGVHNNEPFLRLIASFFNLLLGTSEDSTAYWQNELFRTVRDSFFYISKVGEELDEKTRLRDLIDDQAVFTKLLRNFGVQLKESFWKSFSIQLIFNQSSFLEDTDIELISPVIKRSDLGRFALPISMIDKAECKIKGEETMKDYKMALTMLMDSHMVSYGNIFLSFRYLCRALITQPSDVLMTNLAHLSNMATKVWRLLETSEEDYKLNLKYFLQDLGTLLTYIFANPPRGQNTPEMTTYMNDIFNPYFIAISFTKNKDVLKKRSVLSEALFEDIEELDFSSTKSFWQDMIANTLAKLPNLKAVNFSRGFITSTTMTSLNEVNLKLEKIVMPEFHGSLEKDQYKVFMKTHPDLKDVTIEASHAPDLLQSVPHQYLLHFESPSKMFTNPNSGEVDANTIAWLNQRKELKRLHVIFLSVRGAITTKFAAAISQIEDLAFASSSSGLVMVEPLEPILELKNLTRLNLSSNQSKQQDVVIKAPTKLKQLILRFSELSPTLIATIIKNSPDLEFVSTRFSKFNDECCLALLNCPKLEVLRVKQAAVTAEGMKSIGKCKSLKELTLGDKDRAIDGAAIEHLFPILPNLEVLDLFMYETLSNDSVKTILTTCKRLRKLKLPPSVDDKGFEVNDHGSKQTLTYLNILTTKVTDVGMETIINNYPNMKRFKAPWTITVSTFKRFHNWHDLKRIVLHATIPELQLGINVWSLTINTATESKVVFAELLPRGSPVTALTLVGCLGGATFSSAAISAMNITVFAKLLQMVFE